MLPETPTPAAPERREPRRERSAGNERGKKGPRAQPGRRVGRGGAGRDETRREALPAGRPARRCSGTPPAGPPPPPPRVAGSSPGAAALPPGREVINNPGSEARSPAGGADSDLTNTHWKIITSRPREPGASPNPAPDEEGGRGREGGRGVAAAAAQEPAGPAARPVEPSRAAPRRRGWRQRGRAAGPRGRAGPAAEGRAGRSRAAPPPRLTHTQTYTHTHLHTRSGGHGNEWSRPARRGGLFFCCTRPWEGVSR